MRFYVEVKSLDHGEKESLCVPASSWQGALEAVRALRGELGPIRGFAIDILDQGCRAVDPATRTQYEVLQAPDDAPLTPPKAAPSAAQSTAQATSRPPPGIPRPGVATASPSASLPRPGPPRPTSAFPPRPEPSAPAPATTAAVAPPPPPSIPAPRTHGVGDEVGRVSSPPLDVRLLFKREQDPSAAAPLCYREYVYLVPHGTGEDTAAAILRTQFEVVRATIADRISSKLVNLAAFDTAFEGKPTTLPLATLTWKDWRGDAVMTFPRRDTAGAGAAASASQPSPVPSQPPPAPSRPPPAPSRPPPSFQPPPFASSQPPPAYPSQPAPPYGNVASVAPSAPPSRPPPPPPVSRPPPPPAVSMPEPPPPVDLTVAASFVPPVVPASRASSLPPPPPPRVDIADFSQHDAPSVGSIGTSVSYPPPPPASFPPPPPLPPASRPAPPAAAPPAAVVPHAPVEMRASAVPPAPSFDRPSARPESHRPPREDLIADLFEAMHDLYFLKDALEGAEFCLALALEKLPSRAGIVHFFDVTRREYVVASTKGVGAAALILEHHGEDDPLLSAAAKKRRAVIWSSDSPLPSGALQRFSSIERPKSVIVAPVMQAGRVLGAIELVNPADGGPFEESEGDALSYIGERFAEFISSRGMILDARRIARASARPERGD